MKFNEIDYEIIRKENSFCIYDCGFYYYLKDSDLIYDDWYKTYSDYLPTIQEYKDKIIEYINFFREDIKENE